MSRRATPTQVRLAPWVACLGVAVFFPLSSFAGPPVSLDKVTIHLFLEKAGEFSADVTEMSGFFVSNFVPFSDDMPDGEKVHAFLIKVWFRADGEAFSSGRQARVTVREEKSRRKVFESNISGVYIGPNGRSAHVILVSGHECTSLIVEVASSTKTIKHRLPFHCGE